MKSWAEIQALVEKHSLPFKVQRWNMSLRGVLVHDSGVSVAHNVKDASLAIDAYRVGELSDLLAGSDKERFDTWQRISSPSYRKAELAVSKAERSTRIEAGYHD